MQDVSALVARFYEGHPYPPPAHDLDEAIRNGGYQAGDPTLWAPMLWPEAPRPRGGLKILSAGCGSTQAAWFAHTNRECEVIGVDLSEASLAHQRYLQEKHSLTNLRVFKGDLREVSQIGSDFDIVVCTGVLHHMSDPDEGMRALAAVLAPQGAFVGLVYAAPHRAGVYMMQNVFRQLGVQPDAEGIAFTRRTLASLPQWHFVHRYGAAAVELRHDAALVDTFLHPQDRAYTVPQTLALVEDNGLSFQGWFENSIYYPDGARWLHDELRARISALPEREQWSTMEMLQIANFPHVFFARNGAPHAIAFDTNWRQLTPYSRPWVKRVNSTDYERVAFKFSLRLEEAELFEQTNGERTLGDIQDAAPHSDVKGLFERLWKQGHVLMAKTP